MSTRLYYDQYGIPTDISELEAWSESSVLQALWQ